MHVVTIERSKVRPGQQIRYEGFIYTTSAQRNGQLYIWRGHAADRVHTRISDEFVELVVQESEAAKYH